MKKEFRVLVACEYSGTVRTAFEKKGWDAWSVDILPTEIPGNHYQGDIFEFLKSDSNFDLMIGHPPCTFLSYACTLLWSDEQRTIERIKAADFFMKLYTYDIQHICIENPRGIMYKIFRRPDQEIHPYYFGDRKMKRTGLWLKNLPLLKYILEDDLFSYKTASEKPEPIEITLTKSTGKLKKRYDCDSVKSVCFKNGHERSRFSPAIAVAMADQWTEYFKTL